MNITNFARTCSCWVLAGLVLLLTACGSSEDNSQTSSQASGSNAVVGFVIGQQGPVANAEVTIKSYSGQEVGKATTNAQGEYQISTGQKGPFMGEAKLPSGKVWYSVSQNANMNITHLGDFLIQLWYQANGLNVSTVFANLSEKSMVPQELALNVAANQLLSVPAYALGKGSVDLFADKMPPTLAKILQATVIEDGGQLKIQLPELKFRGVYRINASLTKNGDVIYSGSEETESVNVPLTKGPIAATVGSLSAKRSGSLKSSTDGVQSNEYWMKNNWAFIKDKRYDQLVIPGTHDSGTYKLGWGTGQDTAKTQINSIGDQLKDGIRYFDLRVREAAHWGCADPTVWWIYHNWDSYRLVTAMDEIKAFLNNPGNENEVIILDFQDTKIVYDDERARDVLLKSIQDQLGAYLAKDEPGWSWQKASMAELVSKNKRVIVLLENFLYNKISNPDYKPGCGVTGIDYRNFANRTTSMISAYDEDYAKSAHQIQYLIGSEFDQAYMSSGAWTEHYKNYSDRWEIWYYRVQTLGMAKEVYRLTFPDSALLSDVPRNPGEYDYDIYRRVKNYTEFPKSGKLRVLQLVARPSNAWMAGAAAAPFGGDDLLSYATREINAPLNFKEGCKTGEVEGWLGKRLRMGLEGDPAKWNPPNIIIADNYQANQWVVPDYRNGQWVKGQVSSYVDMAIALNRIDQTKRRLQDVTNFEDGRCLQ